MMKTHITDACLLVALGAFGGAARAGQESVPTYVRMLVGKTDVAVPKEDVQVVPGTVILPGENTAQKAVDLLRVIDDLKESYRLDRIEVASSATRLLAVGEAISVPSVAGGPILNATLTGADTTKAVYRITLKEGEKVLAEPMISVRRGGSAIVGSRDGSEAPYLFALIEALPSEAKAIGPVGVVKAPKAVHRVDPKYPPEAKKAGMAGLVLVEATIGTDGAVKDTRVVRGEPFGLSEAAVDAVKQWRFTPVLDASGAAVEAKTTVIVNFKLSPQEQNPQQCPPHCSSKK